MYYFSSTVLLSMILFDSGLRKYGGMGIEALKMFIKKKFKIKIRLKNEIELNWLERKVHRKKCKW